MHEGLLTHLRKDLTRPRALTPQVCRHLASTYELADDEIGRFLDEQLPELEEFRVELLFGPLFTPTLEDRASYSSLLCTHRCSQGEIDQRVGRLNEEKLACDLELPTGQSHRLRLADVLVERYVRLLYLGNGPQPEFARRLEQAIPGDDVDLALASLREEVWHDEAKCGWLAKFLDAVAGRRSFSMRKLAFLSELLRGQIRPETERLLSLTRSLFEERRSQLGQAGAAKPFFARHIEQWHGHGRDQRRVDPAELETKEELVELLEDLVVDLEHMVSVSQS